MNKEQPAHRPRGRRSTSFAEARAEARERRQRRVRDLQHDERFDRLRSLGARRSLVVAGYLMLLGSAALGWIAPEGAPSAAAPLVFLVGIGIAFLVRRTIRNIDDLEDDALDERLFALRDAAYRRAYVAVIWVTLSAILGLMIGLGQEVEHRHLQALFYAFALGAMLTPTAVLAWNEKQV